MPLENYLQNNSDSHNETAISWGLHQVLVRSEKTHQSNVKFNNNNNGILLVSQNLPHGYRCFTALDKQHPYWLHIYLSWNTRIYLSWNTRTYIHTGDIYISVGTLAHTSILATYISQLEHSHIHPYWRHIYLSWNTRTYIHTGYIYISVGTLAHTSILVTYISQLEHSHIHISLYTCLRSST